MDIEEKYSSLQEEAQGKTRKLKKVWTMLQSAKSELSDVQVTYKYICFENIFNKLIFHVKIGGTTKRNGRLAR